MRVIDYATYKRLERFVLEQHRFNKSQFVSERRMHEMESVMAVDRPSDTE